MVLGSSASLNISKFTLNTNQKLCFGGLKFRKCVLLWVSADGFFNVTRSVEQGFVVTIFKLFTKFSFYVILCWHRINGFVYSMGLPELCARGEGLISWVNIFYTSRKKPPCTKLLVTYLIQ